MHCIEYAIGEEEILPFILRYHRPRRTWNAFVRISLARGLKFDLQQKALDNMRSGGIGIMTLTTLTRAARSCSRRNVRHRGWAAGFFASENEERVFYNTCKSLACPSCGHWATIQWQRERWCALPEGPYAEITFTMPDTLWGIFARNPRLRRRLPEIAAGVIRSYARVRHGVEVGVVPVLHTFNGELLFKPHVHTLVTAGGLQASRSSWHPRFFFHRDELMRSWQRLIIRILRELSETEQLELEIACDELETPVA